MYTAMYASSQEYFPPKVKLHRNQWHKPRIWELNFKTKWKWGAISGNYKLNVELTKQNQAMFDVKVS